MSVWEMLGLDAMGVSLIAAYETWGGGCDEIDGDAIEALLIVVGQYRELIRMRGSR